MTADNQPVTTPDEAIETPLPDEPDRVARESRQAGGNANLVPAVRPGTGEIIQEHLPAALRALYEANFRGSPIVYQILREWSEERAEEVTRLRDERDEARRNERQTRDQLSRSEQRVVALRERLRAETSKRRMRNLALTVGSLIFALALDLNGRGLQTHALIAGVIGGVLVLFGAWPIFGNDEPSVE